jgi:hypothetical protein
MILNTKVEDGLPTAESVCKPSQPVQDYIVDGQLPTSLSF